MFQKCTLEQHSCHRNYHQRDIVTSETHLPTESDIIARVTQTQPDTVEHDDENEEDDVDWEMSPPRRDQVRQPNETLQSCCL